VIRAADALEQIAPLCGRRHRLPVGDARALELARQKRMQGVHAR